MITACVQVLVLGLVFVPVIALAAYMERKHANALEQMVDRIFKK